MDHHISVKQRFYVRVNATRNYRVQDQRHSDTVGHILFRYNRGAAIDHVYTVSPSFLINSRYSYTRYIDGNYPDQDGWDLAGLGFSSTFVNQINAVDPRALRFPQIAASGYSTLSVQAWNKNPVDTHDFALNATKVAGTHSMRFGGGYRIYRQELDQPWQFLRRSVVRHQLDARPARYVGGLADRPGNGQPAVRSADRRQLSRSRRIMPNR